MTQINAEELKQKGNKLFQAGRFDEALASYSRAIIKNPTEATYFTNRALCQLQLKKWDSAADDCRKALELDKRNIKANYYLGKVLIHLGQYDEAVKVLMRAHESVYNQKQAFGDEVAQLLRTARREKFCIEEEKRINQEIDLQIYLNSLIDEDIDRRLRQISEEDNNEGVQQQIESIRNYGSTSKDQLNNLFSQVDERRKKREIPDYLCGKISFELLKEPVITPSGITYERASIKEHLQRVGHFDPVTREPLTVDQLIPNFSLREALEHFTQENEWALNI